MSNTSQKSEHRYTASGPTYRRLRALLQSHGLTLSVEAIDRLERFEGTEDDVRLVAALLIDTGERDLATSLLRNVEG